MDEPHPKTGLTDLLEAPPASLGPEEAAEMASLIALDRGYLDGRCRADGSARMDRRPALASALPGFLRTAGVRVRSRLGVLS